jgi:hypothetical protein
MGWPPPPLRREYVMEAITSFSVLNFASCPYHDSLIPNTAEAARIGTQRSCTTCLAISRRRDGFTTLFAAPPRQSQLRVSPRYTYCAGGCSRPPAPSCAISSTRPCRRTSSATYNMPVKLMPNSRHNSGTTRPCKSDRCGKWGAPDDERLLFFLHR